MLAHKPLNILNASQLQGHPGGATSSGSSGSVSGSVGLLPTCSATLTSSMHSVIIDDISKSSSTTAAATPIYVPTISSTAATLQPPTESHSHSHSHSLNLSELSSLGGSLSSTIGSTGASVGGAGALGGGAGGGGSAASTSGSSSSERLPLAPPPSSGSFKQRFRRSSSKKRPSSRLEDNISAPEEDEHLHQLNNGSDNSCLLRGLPGAGTASAAGVGAGEVPRHKDTNRLSPQNSIRRLSNTLSIGSGPGSRRASACIFNSQVYQNLNQPPKLKPGAGQRRMSSIELAFSKTSHLNLHNLEANRKSLSYTNSKIDLDKWQKSYTNLNEPDMLQQYMEARDKRKNSISHYNLKKRLEEKELQQLQQLHQQQLLQQQQQQQPVDPTQYHSQLPPHQLTKELQQLQQQQQQQQHFMVPSGDPMSKLKMIIQRLTPKHFTAERESYSMYVFPEDNR